MRKIATIVSFLAITVITLSAYLFAFLVQENAYNRKNEFEAISASIGNQDSLAGFFGIGWQLFSFALLAYLLLIFLDWLNKSQSFQFILELCSLALTKKALVFVVVFFEVTQILFLQYHDNHLMDLLLNIPGILLWGQIAKRLLSFGGIRLL